MLNCGQQLQMRRIKGIEEIFAELRVRTVLTVVEWRKGITSTNMKSDLNAGMEIVVARSP